jgi:aldose 1-epimerase
MTGLALRRGSLELDLLPELGGAVIGFRLRTPDGTLDVFRPAPPGTHDILATACFPLVPYSGRIADARLTFQGRTYDVPRTVDTEANALHGDGWRTPWHVERHDETDATITMRGGDNGWPFPYAARQTFRLTANALEVEIGLTNTGDGPMPAGVGLHPWFINGPGVSMRTIADTVWNTDAANLFVGTEPLPDRWDFRHGRRLAGTDICHGFTGWNGQVVLDWPERRLRLTMTANDVLGHLVIYTPATESFFCVEPVSHSVDGFNLEERGVPGNGTVVLAPGDSLVGRVGFLPAWIDRQAGD